MKLFVSILFIFQVCLTQAQPFNIVNTEILSVHNSSTAWGDYDNDGDLDLAITGTNYEDTNVLDITFLYENVGNAQFILNENVDFLGVYKGDLQWADFNGDNLLDLLVVGFDREQWESVTLIYRNIGDGTFAPINGTNILPIHNAAVSCEDFDNDGDTDIFINGYGFVLGHSAHLYTNNGNGLFSEVGTFYGVGNCSMETGDFDNDGDIDIIYSGVRGSNVIKFYENKGKGQLEENNNVFEAVNAGSIASGDYDNDGDLDILISGWENSTDGKTRLYENTGEGQFQENTGANLIGLINCDVNWGDFDNDGDLDVIMNGSRNDNNIRYTRIYRNQGDGNFAQYLASGIQDVYVGTCDWIDVDNDGDLDIFISGKDNGATDQFTLLYRNNISSQNSRPNPPIELKTVVNDNAVSMSWSEGSDNETPSPSLTYNFYLRKEGSEDYICSPRSFLLDGKKKTSEFGNAFLNTTWTIKNLDPGTYHWSVQSVDNSFERSDFAEEKTFSIFNYSNFDVHLYPVPSHDEVFVKLQSPQTGDVQVAVFDVTGKNVFDELFSVVKNLETKKKLELPNLSSGTYYLVATFNDDVVTRRLVILSDD